MIRGYWKHRKQIRRSAAAAFEQLPRVTIQLPIYNEQYVVERLMEETSKIDYPSDRSKSRFSTIRPMKRIRSPKVWWRI